MENANNNSGNREFFAGIIPPSAQEFQSAAKQLIANIEEYTARLGVNVYVVVAHNVKTGKIIKCYNKSCNLCMTHPRKFDTYTAATQFAESIKAQQSTVSLYTPIVMLHDEYIARKIAQYSEQLINVMADAFDDVTGDCTIE